jgi:Holliday junction resolvase RusA-like endonuclease
MSQPGKRIFEFWVFDPPTPMGRKRARRLPEGGVFMYTEEKDERSQGNIRDAFLDAYPGVQPIQKDIPVKMSIKMWSSCPKTYSKRKRVANWMKPVVTKRPDINNIVNQVFDALSKYAYVDDNQITWLGDVMQFYATDRLGNDTQPRMLITVEEL